MTKNELQDLYWMKRNIRKMEDRLFELEAQATKMTTQISAEGSRSGAREPDRLGNIIGKIVDLQNEINYQLAKMYEREREIVKAIESLPSREACLMRLRYINSLSWEKICVEMNYSWRQTHRLHSDALKMLA